MTDIPNMRVFWRFPPNYDKISKAFPAIKGRQGVVFCYDGAIYAPGAFNLPPDVLVHESVHKYQQARNGAALWWDLYIEHPQFRLEQEVPAYRAQIKFAKEYYNAKEATRVITQSIDSLSGPIYGKLVTKDEARALLIA